MNKKELKEAVKNFPVLRGYEGKEYKESIYLDEILKALLERIEKLEKKARGD